MNPKLITREIPRRQARLFLKKAREFSRSARAELEHERWTAAGLAAVHAAISATDSVTVALAGAVNASADHFAAVALLRSCLRDGLPSSAKRQVNGLLRMKSEIEYGQHMLSGPQAKTLVDQAERYVEWASGLVASAGA